MARSHPSPFRRHNPMRLDLSWGQQRQPRCRRVLALAASLGVAGIAGAQAQMQTQAPTQMGAGASGTAAGSAFSAAQRDEIMQIVRGALKRDPSILREAVAAMQADEGQRQEAETRAAI